VGSLLALLLVVHCWIGDTLLLCYELRLLQTYDISVYGAVTVKSAASDKENSAGVLEHGASTLIILKDTL